MNSRGKLLGIFLFLPLLIEGKICPGFCVPQELCKTDGGQILGLCVNRRVCCDVSHKLNRSTCGNIVTSWDSNKPAQFVSPHYPGHSSGNLICQFELKLDKNTVGIKLELDKFELKANSFLAEDGTKEIQCDADMFFIKGFSDWMTNPICGYLNGFTLLIDIEKREYPAGEIILLFIMSSKEYRWRIRIHQILLYKLRKSEICLRTRFAQFSKDPNFLQTVKISKQPTELSLFQQESHPRWKWDVDIVTLANPNRVSCYKNQNHSEPFPFLHKLCSGTILDDRHVITTASCFSKSSPHSIRDLRILTAGFCPVDSRSPGDHYYSVESVTLHFNHISAFIHNDMAILRTKKQIKFREFVQPISIFGGNSRHFLFSPSKPAQDKASQGKVREGMTLQPRNESDCRAAEALHINLSPGILKQYLESKKYSNLMNNWICFPSFLSGSYFTCPADLNLLQGSSLIGVGVSGESITLIGIFSHVVPMSKQSQVPWENSFSRNDTFNSVNSYAYFTKLEFFRNFILMALS